MSGRPTLCISSRTHVCLNSCTIDQVPVSRTNIQLSCCYKLYSPHCFSNSSTLIYLSPCCICSSFGRMTPIQNWRTSSSHVCSFNCSSQSVSVCQSLRERYTHWEGGCSFCRYEVGWGRLCEHTGLSLEVVSCFWRVRMLWSMFSSFVLILSTSFQ